MGINGAAPPLMRKYMDTSMERGRMREYEEEWNSEGMEMSFKWVLNEF